MVAEIKVGVGPRTLLLVEPRGTLSGSAQEAIVLDRGGGCAHDMFVFEGRYLRRI